MPFRRFLLPATCCLLLWSWPARAEWTKVGTTAAGADYFLDPARIRTVSGKVRVWVKMDHRRDRGAAFRSSMTLMAFDCANQLWKMLSVTTFDSLGKAAGSSGMASDYGGYEPILPDSVGERIATFACPVDGG